MINLAAAAGELSATTTRDPKTDRLIAVHEAAHFVVHRWLLLGPSELLTITREGERGGYHRRFGTLYDYFFKCGRNGVTPKRDKAGCSPATYDSARKTFRLQRREYIERTVMVHMAGNAADFELSGLEILCAEGDCNQAQFYAEALYQDFDDAMRFVRTALNSARHMVGGHLKPAILRVADVLQEKRTLDAEELVALWAEVNPGKSVPWSGGSYPGGFWVEEDGSWVEAIA